MLRLIYNMSGGYTMNIASKKVQWTAIQNLIDQYFGELGYKNDGFHSDIIFEGEPYIIKHNDGAIGFFSLGNSWNDGKMFRAFYILPEYRNLSVCVFQLLMSEFDVEAVLVASNDSHLISLSFEKMNALNTSFDMQAFNFVYGKPERKAEFGRNTLSRVTDFTEMNLLTEEQWDGMLDNDNNQFYVMKNGEDILGYGSICSMGYNKKNVDIGNYVLPEHRRKGVGRSLLINLGKIAFEQGFLPVAGCWHGNTESIATLTSAGYISENRIFYVKFK